MGLGPALLMYYLNPDSSQSSRQARNQLSTQERVVLDLLQQKPDDDY